MEYQDWKGCYTGLSSVFFIPTGHKPISSFSGRGHSAYNQTSRNCPWRKLQSNGLLRAFSAAVRNLSQPGLPMPPCKLAESSPWLLHEGRDTHKASKHKMINIEIIKGNISGRYTVDCDVSSSEKVDVALMQHIRLIALISRLLIIKCIISCPLVNSTAYWPYLMVDSIRSFMHWLHKLT